MCGTQQISKIFSPAKINFFFAVTGARTDGYHDVVSINLPLDLGDIITIEPSFFGNDEFTCTNNELSLENNSVMVAVNLFRETAGIRDRFKIHLQKNIPISAGFGGGSSNAASVLVALNKHYGNILQKNDVFGLCRKIGADCGFFRNPVPCITTGIGDICNPVNAEFVTALKQYTMFVFKPPFDTNTADAYDELRKNFSKLYINEHESGRMMQDLIESVIRGDDILPLRNTFFDIFSQKNKVLAWFKHEIQNIGANIMLTGSGSGFFCLSKCPGVMQQAQNLVETTFGKNVFLRYVTVLTSKHYQH